jgi:hypothetical protein
LTIWFIVNVRRLITRVARIREIGALTILSLTGYIYVGFWTRDTLHFYLNDALNRTADALYVTYGRDPHLAAIGFFWPPLPQLIQIPIMPLVKPFGLIALAGPISTAVCVAATIPVLARIGRFLALSRWLTFAICLAFAINPVTVYYAANGMSEASFFFTGTLSLYGFLRYIRTHHPRDMWLFAWALSAMVLTRLEAPVVAVALAFIAAFSWRMFVNVGALKQAAWTVTLIGLPSLASFGTWMAVQWVIEGNPLFFTATNGAGAARSANPGIPPISEEPWASIPWAATHIIMFGGVIALVALSLLVSPIGNRTRGSLGLLATIGAFAAIQIASVGISKNGYGDPRYFVAAVPVAAVSAMWLASTTDSEVSKTWNIALVSLLLVSGASGSWYESSGQLTAIEHECAFFQYGVARLIPSLGRGGSSQNTSYCSPFYDSLAGFQNADRYLDSILKPSDRVLIDNGVMFASDLYTTHPNQFIVRNDRDWQKIAADPYPLVTYILTQSIGKTGKPLINGSTFVAGGGSVDLGAQIVEEDRTAWTLVGSFSELPADDVWVQLYKDVSSQ